METDSSTSILLSPDDHYEDTSQSVYYDSGEYYDTVPSHYSDEGYQASSYSLSAEQRWELIQEEHFKHDCLVRMFTAVSIIAQTVRRAECEL